MTRRDTAPTPDDSMLSLDGMRAIIVEDNYSVAAGLKFLLEGYGCEVAGMAPGVSEAFGLIDREPFDVAILDIDLKGESVVGLADALRRRGDAFLFLSGYSEVELLPPHLRMFPRLAKPADPDDLISTILRIASPTTN